MPCRRSGAWPEGNPLEPQAGAQKGGPERADPWRGKSLRVKAEMGGLRPREMYDRKEAS